MNIIKSMFITCACLSGFVSGQEERPKIDVEPCSVKFNYADYTLDQYGTTIDRGTTICLLLTLHDDKGDYHRIHVRQSRDSQEKSLGFLIKHHLILKDSRVKNMGGLSNFWIEHTSSGNMSSTPKERIKYYLHFDGWPSEHAEWLQLTGELPLYYWSSEKTSEPKSIRLEEGEKTASHIFDVEVVEIKDGLSIKRDGENYQYEIKVKCIWENLQYEIEGFQFMDGSGRIIPVGNSGMRGNVRNGVHTQTNSYLFTEKPEEVKCSVRYKTLEEQKIPMNMRFDLRSGKK